MFAKSCLEGNPQYNNNYGIVRAYYNYYTVQTLYQIQIIYTYILYILYQSYTAFCSLTCSIMHLILEEITMPTVVGTSEYPY